MAIKTKLEEMVIGDKIICSLWGDGSYDGTVATNDRHHFKELGTSVLTISNPTSPPSWVSGAQRSFYFIYVGNDFKGRKILIADRNIAQTVSWDQLNTRGYATKDGVPITSLGLDPSLWKTNIRLLTGGTSDATKANSEWDKYIVSGTGGGQYTAGDNAVWNWQNIYSLTSTTSVASGTSYRVGRGYESASAHGGLSTSQSQSAIGFRPVLVAESLVVPVTKKYLVQDGSDIKAYTTSWQTIGTAPATEEMFTASGMTDINTIPSWSSLGSTFSILEYANTKTALTPTMTIAYQNKSTVSRNANVTAIPLPQLLLPVGDVSVGEVDSVKVDTELIGTYQNAIPVMTGMTTPSGIVTASYDANTGNSRPYLAFDRTTGNIWHTPSSTGWLAYEFPTVEIIKKYTITAYGSDYPTAWTFDGWNGTAWVQLDSKTAQTFPASVITKKEYVINNSAAYKKYRLNFTASSSSMIFVYEVEMLKGVAGNTDIKLLVSGDSGVSWKGLNNTTTNVSDLADVKAKGFAPAQFNALTKSELASLFPNKKARFVFYLEQEKSTDVVQVNSLSINEKQYTLTPNVESASVLYEVLKTEKPALFVSRDDGVTWKSIQADQLTKLDDLPSGKKLRVKAVLSNGQELHALSYSWI